MCLSAAAEDGAGAALQWRWVEATRNHPAGQEMSSPEGQGEGQRLAAGGAKWPFLLDATPPGLTLRAAGQSDARHRAMMLE